MEKKTDRPTIGLALSGGSGRAIAHIGVLEVLREYGVPVDFISACSSGAVVAASYSCGTMDVLKKDLMNLNRREVLSWFAIEKNDQGLFSLEKAEEVFKKYTAAKRFEEIRPLLTLVACDINSGEPVSLSFGDIARAVRISCSVPFLFSPVEWGPGMLVDGGVFTLVPTIQAKQMGADIVIGVDIASTPYMYQYSQVRLRNYFKGFKNFELFRVIDESTSFLWDNLLKVLKKLYPVQTGEVTEIEPRRQPDLFDILDKSMEISWNRQQRQERPICDLMLRPDVKTLGKMNFRKNKYMYVEGRKVALEAIPEIKRLINKFSSEK